MITHYALLHETFRPQFPLPCHSLMLYFSIFTWHLYSYTFFYFWKSWPQDKNWNLVRQKSWLCSQLGCTPSKASCLEENPNSTTYLGRSQFLCQNWPQFRTLPLRCPNFWLVANLATIFHSGPTWTNACSDCRKQVGYE